MEVLAQFETIFTNNNINGIIDFVFSVLLVCLLNVFLFYFVKRKFVFYTNIVLSCLFIVFKTLKFDISSLVILLMILVLTILSLFVNMAEIRHLFANKFASNKEKLKKSFEVEEVFDQKKAYNIINEATLYLSKHKIGAIMTFEKKDKLQDLIRNGTLLNAPLSYELIITIFYPGTRLHDGAVVIHGNNIVAASVYYTPTTKPLVGKYGSRHRAALGISEICDAVTVVISEETGRISIAYNGELESYSPDDFLQAFENIMSQTDVMSADLSTKGKAIDE